MQKWYELWFQQMLFLSEHAAVYLLSVKILFANTKNNQLSNDFTVMSFSLVKNHVYFMKKFNEWIFARLMMGKISPSDNMRIQTLYKLGLGYKRNVSKFPDKHFQHLLQHYWLI